MLKKFLTTAYLLTLTATPVNATPLWAKAIAVRHCEYLAAGYGWEQSMQQSLLDYWRFVPDPDTNSATNAQTITEAVYEVCPNLNTAAYQEHEQRFTKPTFNQQPQWF